MTSRSGALAAVIMALVVVGTSACGPGGNTTADEEAKYKMRDTSKLSGPPPGSMAAPKDFHSSLNDSTNPGGPPAGAAQGAPPPGASASGK